MFRFVVAFVVVTIVLMTAHLMAQLPRPIPAEPKAAKPQHTVSGPVEVCHAAASTPQVNLMEVDGIQYLYSDKWIIRHEVQVVQPRKKLQVEDTSYASQ